MAKKCTKSSLVELKNIGIVCAFVVLLLIGAYYLSTEKESGNDILNVVSTAAPASMTNYGDAVLVSSGKNYYVSGGLFNDSMMILANRSIRGDDIINTDCSNGTGKNCILIFNK